MIVLKKRRFHCTFEMFYRAWYVDGRILVVVVTFGIILPLCLLKNLGKTASIIKIKWGYSNFAPL